MSEDKKFPEAEYTNEEGVDFRSIMQKWRIYLVAAFFCLIIPVTLVLAVSSEDQHSKNWEWIDHRTKRMKTPEGWVVCTRGKTPTFVPDKEHAWKIVK